MAFCHSMRMLIVIFLTHSQFYLELVANQLHTEHLDVICLIKMRMILVGVVIKMICIENVILKRAPNMTTFNKSKANIFPAVETERNQFRITLKWLGLGKVMEQICSMIAHTREEWINENQNRVKTLNNQENNIILKTDFQFNCNHFDHKFHLSVLKLQESQTQCAESHNLKHISIFYKISLFSVQTLATVNTVLFTIMF